MADKLKVVVAGRSAKALEPLAAALAGAPDLACSTHLVGNGHEDSLSRLDPRPEVLVVRFESGDLRDLETMAGQASNDRPPLIVVGPAGNAEAARLAVRSGARDFLAEPVRPDELIEAVRALRNEAARAGRGAPSEIIVVLGAAGGVGTSMVACNLALALVKEARASTLLLDMDLNGAPLASFLDVKPSRGLPAALAELEDLDEQALPGYVVKHASGLRLMGMPAASLVMAKDVHAERLATLLGFLAANFRYIVADGSHLLDDFAVTTLGMARTVVLVVQQSVVQLRQASRLVGTLCNEIGTPGDRIFVVVNRYLKHATVGLDDVRRTLGHGHITVVPSHFKSVLASIDSGIPLLDYDASSPVSRAILELQREIVSGRHVEHRGLLRRALPIFSGG